MLEDLASTLKDAQAALRGGQAAAARELALQVLQAARERDAWALQAQTLRCLAECESTTGKIRDAADRSQQAVHAFRLLKDLPGEAEALTLQAHAASMLGRNEEAVESAMLAVRLLTDGTPASVPRIRALNYLGLAHAWSRQFAPAAQALELATRLADEAALPTVAFQPRINRVYAAVIETITLRWQLSGGAAAAGVRQALDDCRASAAAADPQAMTPGAYIVGQALWGLLSCMAAAWEGDFGQAERLLAQGDSWASRFGATARMNSTACWARAELALARGALPLALDHAREMLAIAASIEHQQLACTAHLLLAQVCEQQGDAAASLAELRRLQVRELAVRADSLASRERVVNWQLEVRRSEGLLRNLESTSREYERLSLEDPLTRIPNRRRFERELGERLALQGQRPAELWIALLDLDGFKAINDAHAHAVGDQVLVRVARLLQANLRERDLAARLGGDEFVVLFHAATEEAARRACGRIERAIRRERWGDLAPGLGVSASIGLACAAPGDTAASILHRSDLQMYALKRRRRPAARKRLDAPL